MAWLDWTILGGSTLALTIFSLYTTKYVKGVADFLSASRSAGRYLLSISTAVAALGAIYAVAGFERDYVSGFGYTWWQFMRAPVGVIIILSGYVYYRFRETRAMTMAQFFQMRYGKTFRIYSGIIAWASGLLNFAIFPIVAARFFVYFCGFPPMVTILGWTIPTVAPIMALGIVLSLVFACRGGQITVMLTDCAQGIYCGFVYVFIAIFLLMTFTWADITAGLKMAPAHASMVNPFDTANVPDFNIWFYLIMFFGAFYSYMSWQGSAAYQCSGLTPHEQKMGSIISVWRGMSRHLLLTLIPLVVYAFLRLPKYAAQAAEVQNAIKAIPTETLQTQMRVPLTLARILPAGLKGLFATIMFFFLITTQDTQMHSWGSMFVQDVILPFRKKPFETRTQLRLLRLSVAGVGVFAFVFGLTYTMREYILMFWAITSAIVSGAGACIVGGMYWKRGTPAGAWTAMTVGWVMAIGRMVLAQIGPHFKDVANPGPLIQAMYYINGVSSQVIWFWIMISCIVSYVVASLLTKNEEGFLLERMLHRGKYAIQGEHVEATRAPIPLWMKIAGVTKEYSPTDRILAYALAIWTFGWFAVFILGTIYELTIGMSDDAWATFWHVWVWTLVIIGIPATIWFTIGGIYDMRKLFRRLATLERDARDDGRVVRHHLPGEEE